MPGPQVFISYATPNQAAAMDVCAGLETAGIACWIAPRNIRAGENYPEAIIRGIRDCSILVLLLSSSANQSPHIAKEVDRAFSQRREILILRVENVEPGGALEYYLSGNQWIDGFSSSLQPAIATLGQRAREILGLPPSAPLEAARPAEIVETPAEETLEPGFCLPWTAWDHAPATISNAAVLVTDHPSLTATDMSRLSEMCQSGGRTPVVVAPFFDGPAIRRLIMLRGVAIKATPIAGQPMNELLADLGIYLGGYAMLSEFGFGLPQAPDTPAEAGGIVRRFMQPSDLGFKDLGMAKEIRLDRQQVIFEDGAGLLSDMNRRIEELQNRAKRYARSQEELGGLHERLRRFGIRDRIMENLVQSVFFAETSNGATLPAGFASQYFVTNAEQFHCQLETPKVFVASYALSDRDSVIPALEAAAKDDQPLVVFAPRIEGEALALLVMNKLRGCVLSLAVETSEADDLAAVCRVSGARILNNARAGTLSADAIGRALGKVREVVSEFHRTRITR